VEPRTDVHDQAALAARRLAARRLAAVARAVRLQRRSAALQAASQSECRLATSARWAAREQQDCELFLIGRLEDGSLATAAWRRGRLSCDPSLKRRAELVIAAGERVAEDGPTGGEPASLSGSLVVVALTLARACSVVLRVELRLPDPLARPD
jgi:hypothetical protein